MRPRGPRKRKQKYDQTGYGRTLCAHIITHEVFTLVIAGHHSSIVNTGVYRRTCTQYRYIPVLCIYRFFDTHVDAHVRRFLSLSRVCKLSSCRCPDRLEWAVLDDADGGAWAYARGVLPGLVFCGVCCTLRQSELTLEEHASKSRKFLYRRPKPS